jgi:hypothetical protein
MSLGTSTGDTGERGAFVAGLGVAGVLGETVDVASEGVMLGRKLRIPCVELEPVYFLGNGQRFD